MRRLKPDFTLLVLAGIYFLTTGCGAQINPPLSGKINMKAGWKPMVYLIQPKYFNEIVSDYRGLVLDSAKVTIDGTFSFSENHLPEGTNVFILTIQQEGNRFANHLIDEDPVTANYMPIVVDKNHPLHITADPDHFQQSFSIKQPDTENLALLSLRDIRTKAKMVYDQQRSHLEENDTLLLEKEELYMTFAQSLMNFADSTSSVSAALVAIRWISTAGDYERVPEFLQKQCDRLNAISPENTFVQELCALTAINMLPILIGDTIPDFEMPLNTGDTIKLHALLGKTLTIVDIWASWCAPCRKENRDYLAPLYATYKDKGLEIIGYSIDSEEASWKKAIAKDQAVWIHSSHLTGDSTPFMDALRITTIPANFILDADGKVVAKNVYGEVLVELVGRYFD